MIKKFEKSSTVKDIIRKALKANFVFSALDEEEIEKFADFMKVEKFQRGSTVIKQGEPGEYFYIVEEGTFTYTIDGKVVGKAQPGSSFG